MRGVAVRLDRQDDRSAYKSDRELNVCELQARVMEASEQRDSAWVRLYRASGDSAKAQRIPPTSGGVGGLYCRATTALAGFLRPREAQAATLTGTAAAAVTAEAATLQPQAPSTGEIVTTGMQLELEIAQHSIDQFRVEIEKKFAIATACIVFVLLGAPIALRFPRGGVGLTIGVSLGVFGIYYVGLLGGEALADRALVDPGIAMWATNLLLGAIGVVLTARLGSEGSTSRGSETSEWWGRFMERFRRRKTA